MIFSSLLDQLFVGLYYSRQVTDPTTHFFLARSFNPLLKFVQFTHLILRRYAPLSKSLALSLLGTTYARQLIRLCRWLATADKIRHIMKFEHALSTAVCNSTLPSYSELIDLSLHLTLETMTTKSLTCISILVYLFIHYFCVFLSILVADSCFLAWWLSLFIGSECCFMSYFVPLVRLLAQFLVLAIG